MKRLLKVLILLSLTTQVSFAKTYQPVPSTVKLPAKYTQEYIDSISDEYKNVSDEQIFHVALDMLKGTSGDFSRKAILGYNVTQYPVKVMFKDLSEINEAYSTFDAIGWKKKGKLYIYINPKHEYAPPGAIAALLAHEAIHQDEYNSLSEETYAWTMEAAVWTKLSEKDPKYNDSMHPLVVRENTLKKLFIKGNYTSKYIRKTVFSNPGYSNLPSRSPGFEDDNL